MTIVWLATSFNYFLLAFLVTEFSFNEYTSGICLGVADMAAFGIAGFVYEKVGVKASIVGAFTLASVAGVLLLTYGLSYQDSIGFVILVFTARFGISFSFCIVFVAHA